MVSFIKNLRFYSPCASARPICDAMQSRVVATISVLFVLGALYLSVVLRAVPARHIFFTLITATYATFANIYIEHASPHLNISKRPRPVAPTKNSPRLLFPFTICFSLLAPSAILIASRVHGIQLAQSSLVAIIAPHLFLILSQIVCENMGYIASNFFSVYIRLGVTVAFVSYRLPVLFTWYRLAGQWANTDEAATLPSGIAALAQLTAILNMVHWSFALLCYLLLYCLPNLIHDPYANPTSINLTSDTSQTHDSLGLISRQRSNS